MTLKAYWQGVDSREIFQCKKLSSSCEWNTFKINVTNQLETSFKLAYEIKDNGFEFCQMIEPSYQIPINNF